MPHVVNPASRQCISATCRTERHIIDVNQERHTNIDIMYGGQNSTSKHHHKHATVVGMRLPQPVYKLRRTNSMCSLYLRHTCWKYHAGFGATAFSPRAQTQRILQTKAKTSVFHSHFCLKEQHQQDRRRRICLIFKMGYRRHTDYKCFVRFREQPASAGVWAECAFPVMGLLTIFGDGLEV